ncbi:MAG: tetratricopeptide repeat protein [Leptospiraceae bacterium]|nr:tetratricopeptide repeat protein [Leptospiraceae bacterium]
MKYIVSLFLFLFFSQSIFSDEKIVYAFRSSTDLDHIRMRIIGETLSMEKASIFEAKPKYRMTKMDTRLDYVTVKILDNPGIRVGQTLYLIEKNPDHKAYRHGNIVGEIKVISIYNTTFFGQRLRGEGHLRLIESKQMTVAMPMESEKLKDAIVVKKQGDYFANQGMIPEAILSYRKSIRLDSYYPDVHYALGRLHMKKGGEGYVSAGFEFLQAWKNRDKFSVDNEKFEFYVDYIKYLNYRFKLEYLGRDSSIKPLKKAIRVFQEAKQIHPKDYELILAVAESYYLLFENSLNSKQEEKKRDLEYAEKAEEYINNCLNVRSNDYRLQRIAALYYYQLWRDPNSRALKGDSDREREALYREKTRLHANQYRTFKPSRLKLDKQIIRILEEFR